MLHPKQLFHVTTPKKLERYKASKRILSPVRGFTTIDAAKEWAAYTGRSIILRFDVQEGWEHKLPDHHQKSGQAWWQDKDVLSWDIVWKKENQ